MDMLTKEGVCPGRIAQLFPRVNSSTFTLVQVPMDDVETNSPEQGLYCLLLTPGVMWKAVYTQVIELHLQGTVSYVVQSLHYTYS